MSEEKKVPTFTITVARDEADVDRIVGFESEANPNPWWRDSGDRKKDGVLLPEIWQHMTELSKKLAVVNDKGQYIAKYNMLSFNLSPNPKSSQGKKLGNYRALLKAEMDKRAKGLEKFRDKELFIYLCVYLREKRYLSNDADNFVKVIIDSMKKHFGDDSKVVNVFVEKRKLDAYPEEDMDFLEQTFIIVTTPDAKKDLFKE